MARADCHLSLCQCLIVRVDGSVEEQGVPRMHASHRRISIGLGSLQVTQANPLRWGATRNEGLLILCIPESSRFAPCCRLLRSYNIPSFGRKITAQVPFPISRDTWSGKVAFIGLSQKRKTVKSSWRLLHIRWSLGRAHLCVCVCEPRNRWKCLAMIREPFSTIQHGRQFQPANPACGVVYYWEFSWVPFGNHFRRSQVRNLLSWAQGRHQASG